MIIDLIHLTFLIRWLPMVRIHSLFRHLPPSNHSLTPTTLIHSFALRSYLCDLDTDWTMIVVTMVGWLVLGDGLLKSKGDFYFEVQVPAEQIIKNLPAKDAKPEKFVLVLPLLPPTQSIGFKCSIGSLLSTDCKPIT
jgi:hypothetical protein